MSAKGYEIYQDQAPNISQLIMALGAMAALTCVPANAYGETLKITSPIDFNATSFCTKVSDSSDSLGFQHGSHASAIGDFALNLASEQKSIEAGLAKKMAENWATLFD